MLRKLIKAAAALLLAFVLTTLVVASFSTCARLAYQPAVTAPTLLVHNEGLDPETFYDGPTRVGVVYPGHSECFRLRANGERALFVRIMGVGYVTPLFSPSDFGGGWQLDLGLTPAQDMFTLRPGERCDG